jgi:DENN (AEX-3) domain
VRGVVNCFVPFLSGERLLIVLPPRSSLPPLPHGNAAASVCRLLGADGINFFLAAFPTEFKILLHSDDVANLCLVAEVMTALIYPFYWSLPSNPLLPTGMMEILEAPLSFL